MSESPPRSRDDADAKAWFYLDHQHDIEEWAALRQEGRQLLERHLLGLGPAFGQLATRLNADAAYDLDSKAERWVGLRRSSWHHADLQTASIRLQWHRDKLFIVNSAYEWPFVGVHVSAQDPERQGVIADALAAVRLRLRGTESEHWPFWRFVQPSSDSTSVDPEELARRALQEFSDVWNAAAPILDAV